MVAVLVLFGVAVACGAARGAPSPDPEVAPEATASMRAPDGAAMQDQGLPGLRRGHPRLILLRPEVDQLKSRIQADPRFRRNFDRLERQGDSLLSARTMVPGRRNLVGPARNAGARLYALGLLYRLDGQDKWRARAIEELLAVSRVQTWASAQCLDAAEMTHSVAIGYDWLFPDLNLRQRDAIARSIVVNGLQPYLRAFGPGGAAQSIELNRAVVCHGAALIGALAVADRDSAVANAVIALAVRGLRQSMSAFGPDGAWPEGPTYWGYAARYAISAIAALQTALGSDSGLSQVPGFAQTALYGIQIVGPTGAAFNYSDAAEIQTQNNDADASLLWLARRFAQPAVAAIATQAEDRADAPMSARALLWTDANAASDSLATLPLDARFRGPQVVTMRSSWRDQNALFVGFKGGDASFNHAHLDRGSFVLDALGQRWASDLGAESYSVPDYFGRRRFTYYRTSTRGHNVLQLNNQNQELAEAPVTEFAATSDAAMAIVDLTSVYPGVRSARRGITLRDRRSRVLVQDEIDAAQPITVDWGMHTYAAVSSSGTSVTLTLNGQTLTARILAPANALFTVSDVTLNPPETAAPGLKRLSIRLGGITGPFRLAVLLTPGTESLPAPPLWPLSQWVP